MVETGMRVPPDGSWPAGSVRLLAWRTPTIWLVERPASASFAGSRVTTSCSSVPPVRSARATPSSAWISGTISVRAISATRSRPSWDVAAIDALMTGAWLMFSAWTVVSTEAGSPAVRRFASMAATVSLTSLPNSNWATTSATEFAEVDWIRSSRATPAIARSIGLATCSATSLVPAPGYGATIVTTGKSTSGRSSCLRSPQAVIPKMNTAAAKQQRDAALADGELAETAHWGTPSGWPRCAAPAITGAAAASRIEIARSMTASSSSESRSSRVRIWWWLSSRMRSSVSVPGVGERDDHLAAIGRVGATLEQPELDETVDDAARGAHLHAEPRRELRHAQRLGGGHDVQDLGLGHRHADLGELGRMGGDHPVHELVERVQDPTHGGARLLR